MRSAESELIVSYKQPHKGRIMGQRMIVRMASFGCIVEIELRSKNCARMASFGLLPADCLLRMASCAWHPAYGILRIASCVLYHLNFCENRVVHIALCEFHRRVKCVV